MIGEHNFKSGFVMLMIERADGVPFKPGVYLKSANSDANDGMGSEEFTYDIREAKRFTSTGELLEYWKRQSTVNPIRPDGKPNRPLTAYTVSPEPFAILNDLRAAVNPT